MPTTHGAVERSGTQNEITSEAALMIRSAHIKNFRCFEDVRVTDLGLINIVVGDNRSGKTSLLEALYLVTGNNLENHLKLRAWRGIGNQAIHVRSTDVASGAFWRDMFYQFELENSVSIEIEGDSPRQLRRFAARYKEPKTTIVGADDATAAIEFTFTEGKKSHLLVPRFTANGLVIPNVPNSFIEGAMLAGATSSQEIAERFSALDIENRAEGVIGAIRSEFPEIRALSLQAVEGLGLLLHADTGLSRKIPLPMISAGVNKLVSILLAIEAFPGGVIFIDEIENGFYYQRLEGLWRTLAAFASESKPTQLFATTHSGEALDQLMPVVADNPSLFRLIRAVRPTEGGGSILRVFDGHAFADALEDRVEVR